jgi:hypothetical protein
MAIKLPQRNAANNGTTGKAAVPPQAMTAGRWGV